MNSRRNFLKQSSLGAGLLTLPALPAISPDRPDDIRITDDCRPTIRVPPKLQRSACQSTCTAGMGGARRVAIVQHN